jgi:CubicO group peptidase (beta-lactamase class C family)
MSNAIESHDAGQERANLANWRTTPYSRWAFHNVREIIPIAEIKSDSRVAAALPRAARSMDGFNLALSDGSALDLPGFLNATATDALVAMIDGQIAYEFYGNGTTEQTPHILMSATKAVVGLIVGILQNNGDIDVGADASKYMPEIAATAYKGATIRQLLDMRTGITLDEGQLRAYLNATNWEPVAPGETLQGFQGFFEQLKIPSAPHGGPFRYISANTDLLGLIIERATGRKFAPLVSELLWRPMGAERDAYITVDRGGAPRCTGGLCATARDFARIGQLMVEQGQGKPADILPKAWIEDIAENGDRQAWRAGEWGKSFAAIGTDMSYRSGWYIVEGEPQTLFAIGIYGQNLFIDRTNGIVVAKLSSQSAPIDYQAIAFTHLAIPEIRRCLLGRVS